MAFLFPADAYAALLACWNRSRTSVQSDASHDIFERPWVRRPRRTGVHSVGNDSLGSLSRLELMCCRVLPFDGLTYTLQASGTASFAWTPCEAKPHLNMTYASYITRKPSQVLLDTLQMKR
jgi:hypothetical protein